MKPTIKKLSLEKTTVVRLAALTVRSQIKTGGAPPASSHQDPFPSRLGHCQ